MRKQELPPIPSKQVEKYLNKLGSKTRKRLLDAIEKIPEGDIKPYEGTEYSRLRKGRYRVLFRFISDNQIYVSYIGVRGDAYKKGV